MEGLAGAGHGGIDPLVVGFGGVEGDVARHVDIDLVPLATLGLVAGDGIAVVAAQGIQVGVIHHHLVEAVRFLLDTQFTHPDDEIGEQGGLLHLVEVG